MLSNDKMILVRNMNHLYQQQQHVMICINNNMYQHV
jgi:hypothetical protein